MLRVLPCRALRGAAPMGLLILALLLSALAGPLSAQQTADIIRGRVLGPDSQPVQQAQVSALSYVGGILKVTRTDRSGKFSFVFPNGENRYWITINAIGFQSRRFELRRRADEDILLADAQLSRTQDMQAVTVTAKGARGAVPRLDNYQEVTGADRSITAGYSIVTPDQAGNLAALASAIPGVQFIPGIDGAPDQFSIFGLAGDQNNATLNGMQQSLAKIPMDANLSLQLRTGYDVAIGRASGATVSMSTTSGTNQIARQFTVVASPSQTQFNDVVGRTSQYGALSIGGRLSGPRRMDKDFYNVSAEFDHREQDITSLASSAPAVFQSAGIAPDSVNRLRAILHSLRIPITISNATATSRRDDAIAQGTFDWAAKSPTSGQALTFSFNGNFQHSGPAAISPLTTPAALSTNEFATGGVLLRHTNYFASGMLTESEFGASGTHRTSNPQLDLPFGNVLVTSTLSDGTTSTRALSFGGNPNATTSSSFSAGMRNTLSRISDDNHHRTKLISELTFEGAGVTQAQNLLGQYTYQSLADLALNNPSSYTRRLNSVQQNGSAAIGGLALGDSWRAFRNVQLQYGLRIDMNAFLANPVHNTALQSALGADNAHMPNRIYLSPRFGFSKVISEDRERNLPTGGQYGFYSGRTLTGGIGLFQNVSGPDLISSALTNTGLNNASQQVTCVGSDTPRPDWSSAGSEAVSPATCLDGSASDIFRNNAPAVVLFAKHYVQPRTLRSTLNWTSNTPGGYFTFIANATYGFNFNQGNTVDINFAPSQQFTLTDEGGRPVYARPQGIDAASGIVAAGEARVTPLFSRVLETRSNLTSQTAQLHLELRQYAFLTRRMMLDGSYTFMHTRQQFGGFSSTAGDPLVVESSRSPGFDHEFDFTLRFKLGQSVAVLFNGRLTSGTHFTPTVAGDINGDGYARNDRAFVFDPARSSDEALAEGMRTLLAHGAGAARNCLSSQLNSIARNNSCTGPWSWSNSFISAAINPVRLRLPQRMNVSVTLNNPLATADMLLHRDDRLHGWGQLPSLDGSLLYVRAFNPATMRYRYDVNQRFGATSAAKSAYRTPVVLEARVRIDLAPRREWQDLYQAIERGRSRVGTKMTELAARQYPSTGNGALLRQNPLSYLLMEAEYLHLSRLQADSIARASRRFNRLADSLWIPIAKQIATLPHEYDHKAIESQVLAARQAAVRYWIVMVPQIMNMLTKGQRLAITPSIRIVMEETFWRQQLNLVSGEFTLFAVP